MENQYTDRFLNNLLLTYWPTVMHTTVSIVREGCTTRISGRDPHGSLVTIKFTDNYMEVSAKNGETSLASGLFTKDFLIALRSLA